MMDQTIRTTEPIFFIMQDGSTHFEGTSVYVSITDTKGSEVFRKIFDSEGRCQEFVDTYCISFKGVALFYHQHPLIEIFQEKSDALSACNEGHLIVNAVKEIVTILDPADNSPQYSKEWQTFKIRITVEKIVTHVYTRYNQVFAQHEPVRSSNLTHIHEGIINKSRSFFCNS